jgi:hypothetical protein
MPKYRISAPGCVCWRTDCLLHSIQTGDDFQYSVEAGKAHSVLVEHTNDLIQECLRFR